MKKSARALLHEIFGRKQQNPNFKGNLMSRTRTPYDGENDFELPENSYCQWGSTDGRIFLPYTNTAKKLIPGVYEIRNSSQIGIHFERIPIKTEGLIRFPDTRSDQVLNEVQKFWERESWFQEYGLTYKRGIILYGPPGVGKTGTIQLVVQDVVQRDGIVLEFGDPYLFIDGIRIVRLIQPESPIVVVMEDIDSLIEIHNESEILNILDGVNEVNKVVFLATTNYPDKLGPRIVNRPSRFDKRFRIGFPSEESRRIYFENMIGNENIAKLGIDINRWISDTDAMSIAHLKELFVAVIILGDDYGQALETLRTMKEEVKDSDFEGQLGFSAKEKDEDFYN